MHSVSLLATLALTAAALPSTKKRDSSNPTVKGEPEVIGLLADPNLNRDSCGSSKYGDRALWLCRDSQHYDEDGVPILPLISDTASWTDILPEGGSNLLMYGDNQDQPFLPLLNCTDNVAGACDDGSRYAVWPDSPPLVTSDDNSTAISYVWNRNIHINGLEDLIPDPSVALYRLTYNYGDDGLPEVEVVDEKFWEENAIPYGAYGSLVHDDTAYLWGKGSDGAVSLARVPTASVEDKSTYEYYVNGEWTGDVPSFGDDGVDLENASAGGQGTYYYSDPWESYVWIGQETVSVSADFFITTAPEPQGPWIEPINFHSAETGNDTLGAYTLQANPALTAPGANEIYLTYTKTDKVSDDVALYTMPLIHVEWE